MTCVLLLLLLLIGLSGGFSGSCSVWGMIPDFIVHRTSGIVRRICVRECGVIIHHFAGFSNRRFEKYVKCTKRFAKMALLFEEDPQLNISSVFSLESSY